MAKYLHSIGIGQTVTSTQVDILISGAKHILLFNDGPQEVYFRTTQRVYDTPVVTDSGVNKGTEIKSGEFVVLDTDDAFSYISLICSSGETAAIRGTAWF